MSRLVPPYIGMVSAAGFIIEVALIGEDEARRRVLGLWSPGAVAREIDPSRWLLALPRVIEVRCEHAPGLPLDTRAGGFAPVGSQDIEAGRLTLSEGHQPATYDLKELRLLHPGQWVDLRQLTPPALTPPPPPPPPAPPPPPPAPPKSIDLRSIAGLGARSARAQAAVGALERASALRHRRGTAGTAGTTGRPNPLAGLLAGMLMRSPAAPVIRHKHDRYLRSLTEAFERKRFDEALRDAIALGGEERGFLSLRLPKRRDLVRGPSNRLQGGGGSIPWGSTVHEHLQNVYRTAAEELEKEGRLQEAAFVLADLMMNVAGAVAMLERHDEYLLAADLAEGRRLEADLVVRLLWRAGERDRALAVARARGAYAMAIKRLETTDAAAAGELRVAWSADLAAAGDYLGAVEAIWPDQVRRPSAAANIARGMSMGGPVAAHLFAYQLALQTNDAARAAARALVTSTDPALAAARGRFVRAFAELPSANPAADRELASLTMRQLLDATTTPRADDASARRVVSALRQRMDPLLRADLPLFEWHRRSPSSDAQFVIRAGGEPGQLAVHDVVPLTGGLALTALGSHGVRLITPAGRTRAQWDFPTNRIIIADHGSTALLANDLGDDTWDLHTLDLVTRQVRPWCALRISRLPSSYDGSTLIVVDHDGTINFLDVRQRPAKTLWREVTDENRVVDLVRAPGKLSAVVLRQGTSLRPESGLEAWQWDLPSIALRSRRHLDWLEGQVGLTTADALVRLEADDSSVGTYTLTTNTGSQSVRSFTLAADSEPNLISDGTRHAIVSSDQGRTRLALTPRTHEVSDLDVLFEDQTAPRFRSHDDLVAVWDALGRIVVADLEGRCALANMRTRL